MRLLRCELAAINMLAVGAEPHVAIQGLAHDFYDSTSRMPSCAAYCCACSVYSRLLQCPNSALRGAAAAHLKELKAHATAAQALRRDAPRAPFELGWAAWTQGGYGAAAFCFRRVLLLAAEADDDIFVAAGSWALASAVALGGAGLVVPTAQVAGLMQLALAAEKRLRRWSMTAATKSIIAFARQPLRQLALGLPSGSLCFLAVPEMRSVLCSKPRGSTRRTQRQCAACKGAFAHMLRCGGCRAAFYCSEECHKAAWPVHSRRCCKSSVTRKGAAGQ